MVAVFIMAEKAKTSGKMEVKWYRCSQSKSNDHNIRWKKVILNATTVLGSGEMCSAVDQLYYQE